MRHTVPDHAAAWLRRVNQHPIQDRCLLSGSMLIAALCQEAREPNDLDYAMTGGYDDVRLRADLTTVAGIPDGPRQLIVEGIEEIYEYSEQFPGMRADLIYVGINAQHIHFTVDCAYGDPLTIAPRMLAIEQVGMVRVVALETLYAWKVHALVQFGRWGWRPKDLYDLHIMWQSGLLDGGLLSRAIEVAFSSRAADLEELDAFRYDDTWGREQVRQQVWRQFAHGIGRTLDFEGIRANVRTALHQLL
jgi:Nucleotidyl transferase AbiEii toxin, Type IV TA system